jgi:hypothetical protein
LTGCSVEAALCCGCVFNGRMAGPLSTCPSGANWEPWQGQSQRLCGLTILFSSTLANILWVLVVLSLLLPWLRTRQTQRALERAGDTARSGL